MVKGIYLKIQFIFRHNLIETTDGILKIKSKAKDHGIFTLALLI